MKQVIVVNGGLGMPVGKLAAQVAHAAVGGFRAAAVEARERWVEEGMPKIVLGVPDEARLLALFEAAQHAHLPLCLVRDAGKTLLPAGTITCLGIGPAPEAAVDALTGSLPLLP